MFAACVSWSTDTSWSLHCVHSRLRRYTDPQRQHQRKQRGLKPSIVIGTVTQKITPFRGARCAYGAIAECLFLETLQVTVWPASWLTPSPRRSHTSMARGVLSVMDLLHLHGFRVLCISPRPALQLAPSRRTSSVPQEACTLGLEGELVLVTPLVGAAVN